MNTAACGLLPHKVAVSSHSVQYSELFCLPRSQPHCFLASIPGAGNGDNLSFWGVSQWSDTVCTAWCLTWFLQGYFVSTSSYSCCHAAVVFLVFCLYWFSSCGLQLCFIMPVWYLGLWCNYAWHLRSRV